MDSLGLHNNMVLQSGMLPAETKTFSVQVHSNGTIMNPLTYNSSKYAVITITQIYDTNSPIMAYGNGQSFFIALSTSNVGIHCLAYYNVTGSSPYLGIIGSYIYVSNTQLAGGGVRVEVRGIITLYR